MEERKTIARVIVDLNLNRIFDYRIPEGLASSVRIGSHVNVPFGKRRICGCIVDLLNSSDCKTELREIEGIFDKRPVLPQSLVKLGEWMAEYYCCSKEHAVRALLPGAVRSGRISKKTITFAYLPDPKKAGEYIFSQKKKSTTREKVVELLLQHPDMPLSVLKKRAGCSEAVINTLVKAGIVCKEKKAVDRDPFAGMEILQTDKPELTSEQETAFAAIKEMITGPGKGPSTALLFGVTGSGKTEVYLRAIEEILKKGRDAIVLVPEISLTPQTTERFRARFGNNVSVLHSGLSDGERYDEWMKIYEGRVNIAVGARSALFAPFRNPGLIIVDEEHENSYKQDEAPRYNARDVAVMRARMEGAVAILGSATPSFESFYNASTGKYRLLELTRRIDDRLMPEVKIIDMRMNTITGGSKIFSRELTDAVNDRLRKSEQVILFLNRRGFATHLSCNYCGYTAECPNCSVDYTYHRANDYLSCHICGALAQAPVNCPSCGAPGIKYSGVGTEKIEVVASSLFPLARIKRMDSDTMTHRKSYEKLLSEFRRKQIDILIGTQMLAKGLDFPNVTLVGVINADHGLHMPDFRAAERTFQLLMQVSGRSGRGAVPGEVYIQTYTPFNPAVQDVTGHDYAAFYKDEIEVRNELDYPPKTHLATVRFSGENESEIMSVSARFHSELAGFVKDELRLSPVAPSPIPKINNKFRYCMMLRGTISMRHKNFIKHLIYGEFRNSNVTIIVDVDALNLM